VNEHRANDQKNVVLDLRHKELAIEAMKRKIQAKMKGQGLSSTDGVVQRIAVNFIESADTPGASPSVQTPDSATANSVPTTALGTPAEELPRDPTLQEQKDALPRPIPTEIPLALQADTPVQDLGGEADEEARLLAELEAERHAEEHARQKRRELEERLALARGKRTRRSMSAASERDGPPSREKFMNPAAAATTMQDSTSSLV
jgi:hypothetical protein